MDYFTIDKLKSDKWAGIIPNYRMIRDYRKLPKKLVSDILKGESYTRDIYSPMKKGPDWLYEELAIYQPKTASLLKNSPLYVNNYRGYEVCSLFQIINGRIMGIIRLRYGNHPCDDGYHESKKNDPTILWKSLPEALQKAYFYKFNGLEMFLGNTFSINGFQLINWNGRPLIDFLGDIRKKRNIWKNVMNFLIWGRNIFIQNLTVVVLLIMMMVIVYGHF